VAQRQQAEQQQLIRRAVQHILSRVPELAGLIRSR
jgi:hypothetical protein